MTHRGEQIAARSASVERESLGPQSARSSLVVLLMFHGLIISQVAIVLARLVPDWAKTYSETSVILSSNSRLLVALSELVMENPILTGLVVAGFLLGESVLFLGTWRIKPKRAVTWWMRGTFAAGITLIGWLYVTLYLTTLQTPPVGI